MSAHVRGLDFQVVRQIKARSEQASDSLLHGKQLIEDVYRPRHTVTICRTASAWSIFACFLKAAVEMSNNQGPATANRGQYWQPTCHQTQWIRNIYHTVGSIFHIQLLTLSDIQQGAANVQIVCGLSAAHVGIVMHRGSKELPGYIYR